MMLNPKELQDLERRTFWYKCVALVFVAAFSALVGAALAGFGARGQ